MLTTLAEWGLGGVQSWLTEWALTLSAIGCLAGAAVAYAQLPFLGRYIAAALVAVAAGLGAYDMGYAARGRLDQSQALRSQLAAAREQLQGAQLVQEAAAARARESDQQAIQMQEQIRDYEAALNSKPAAAGAPDPCRLGADDAAFLNRLRDGAGPGGASRPSGRAR